MLPLQRHTHASPSTSSSSSSGVRAEHPSILLSGKTRLVFLFLNYWSRTSPFTLFNTIIADVLRTHTASRHPPSDTGTELGVSAPRTEIMAPLVEDGAQLGESTLRHTDWGGACVRWGWRWYAALFILLWKLSVVTSSVSFLFIDWLNVIFSYLNVCITYFRIYFSYIQVC